LPPLGLTDPQGKGITVERERPPGAVYTMCPSAELKALNKTDYGNAVWQSL